MILGSVDQISFSFKNIDEPFDLPLAYSYWLKAVTKEENKTIEFISFIFTDDDSLLAINRDHLQHDYYTDVITFPYAYDPIQSDIYISIDRAKDNAEQLGVTWEVELRRIMVHGVLHMCGYDDKSPAQKSIMTQKEDYYLSMYNPQAIK